MADEDFQKSDAGVSLAYPDTAGNLKVNGHVVMKDTFPCKILDISHAKPGKHGAAKVNCTSQCIFTQKKFIESFSAGSTIMIPNIKRVELQLIDMDEDGFMTLMTEGGETKEDVKLTDDDFTNWATKMKQDFDDGKEILVTVIASMGQEKAMSYREFQTA